MYATPKCKSSQQYHQGHYFHDTLASVPVKCPGIDKFFIHK